MSLGLGIAASNRLGMLAPIEVDVTYVDEVTDGAGCSLLRIKSSRLWAREALTSFDEKIVVDNHSSVERPHSRSGASTSASNTFGSKTINNLQPVARNKTMMQSPRNLPLGRNRRISNDMHKTPTSPSGSENRFVPRSPYGSPFTELPASVPQYKKQAPTSNPTPSAVEQPEQMMDVVAELAKWRRERKAAYEAEVLRRNRRPSSATSNLADLEIFVEGHWSGEVKVYRNAKKNVPKGKMERKGNVDIFGNYFEGGYLYP